MWVISNFHFLQIFESFFYGVNADLECIEDVFSARGRCRFVFLNNTLLFFRQNIAKS